jgi:MFS family permease
MTALSDTKNERNVLLLTGAGHFSTHFFELMFPTLAVVLARDSGIPLEQVLGWSFLGYLLFGLGALPAGLIADRVGARVMLIVAMGGMGISALAAAEVEPGRPIVVCLALMGLFGSIYHPAGMGLISHAMRARGRALGINGMFGNLAIALTPIVTATLCERIGWQSTYRAAGFAMLGLTAFCALLPIRERPLTPHAILPVPPGANRPSDRTLFLLLCIAAMFGGLSYRGNTVVQPAYFAEHVSLLSFGAATSLVYLFGIGGQLVGGALADRYDLRWLYLGFHALSLPALLAMVSFAELPLVSAGAVFVFFSLGMQPIENSLFARFTPPRWRATGYGIKFVLTFGVGAFAVRLIESAKTAGDLSLVLLYLAGVVALLLVVIGLFVALTVGQEMHNESAARIEVVRMEGTS